MIRGTIFWPQEVTQAQVESVLKPLEIHFGSALQNQGRSYYEAGDISLFVADRSAVLSLAGDFELEALTLAANQVAADNNQARGLIACLDPETKNQISTLTIHEGVAINQAVSEAECRWFEAGEAKGAKARAEDAAGEDSAA